jgi:hypothetical protein
MAAREPAASEREVGLGPALSVSDRGSAIHQTAARSIAQALGWLLIVPPFVSMYNTSLHLSKMEERAKVPVPLSPAINIVILLVFAFGTAMYTQEHLNRVWEASASSTVVPPLPPLPPSPVAGRPTERRW